MTPRTPPPPRLLLSAGMVSPKRGDGMARQLKRELSRGRTRNALRWLTVVAALALGVWMGETSPASA